MVRQSDKLYRIGKNRFQYVQSSGLWYNIWMNNRGLQGESRFGEMHPAAISVYYVVLMVIIMISN